MLTGTAERAGLWPFEVTKLVSCVKMKFKIWALWWGRMTLRVTTSAHSHQQFETYFGVGKTCDLVSAESTTFCHACELPQCHAFLFFSWLWGNCMQRDKCLILCWASVEERTRTSLCCSLFMYWHDGAFLKLIVALYPITAVMVYAHSLFIIAPFLPGLPTHIPCHQGQCNLRIEYYSSYIKLQETSSK